MATKLTPLKVENQKSDPVRRIEIADTGKPGLYLVVQPSGKKSWAVRYRRLVDRSPCKFTIEGFPSLATARKLAQAALDKVAEGQDPASDKRESKREAKQKAHAGDTRLVDGLFRDFLDKHVRKKNGEPIRETTRAETARLLGLKRDAGGKWIDTGGGVLARWKGRAVDRIGRADVRDLLDELVEAGPVTANRSLTALKTCFAWAVKRDRLDRSPCDGVDDPSPESARDHVITDAELAALWRAAANDEFSFGRMVQLLILTGCRRDEVRDARRSEFDLKERQWLIPGDRTKNGREHLVPLSDSAVRIVESLPKINGSALLFTTTGNSVISGLSRAKTRLNDAMSKELGAAPDRWTLHDLRRTFVTGLQRLGFALEVAEACVNHKSGTLDGVAGVYARHDYAHEKRKAFDAWARHVENIVSGKAAKVLPLVRERVSVS